MAISTKDSGCVESEGTDPDALAVTAALFRGLADPTRLAILRHLALGEHRVRDLTEHLGLAQSTVSAHLACLRDCGLVTSRPQGRASLFSLACEPELRDVLTAAERLLTTTAGAVAACPTYGVDAHDTAPPRAVPRTDGQGPR